MANVDKKYTEEYRKRAEELVSQMTLEEKVSQMIYNAGEIRRLGIDSYNWWNEALHGVARAGTATVFPQAIGLAAMFDEEELEKVGDAVSTEGRAKFNAFQSFGDRDIYKGLTFWSPNINIFRDPRWGRGHETYGEDPYLTSRMGIAFINGMQGYDKKYLKSAACVKHYAVHSGPEAIRHSFDVDVSKKDLYETYLEAFHNCIEEADVEGLMGAYNCVYGEPCCGSKYLLLDVLRGKWGFNGYMTSDCGAIWDFHENHKVTKSPEESARLAVVSGCDVNCGCTYPYLVRAVQEGIIDEKDIDVCVVRLLTTRMKLGEFDDPKGNPYSTIPYSEVDSPKMRAFNKEVAKKCVVLLKNKDSILPLDKNKIKTIGVIGPNADSRAALVGNYEGKASHYQTVIQGIEKYLEDTDVRILYSQGCHLFQKSMEYGTMENNRSSEVKAVCRDSDVVVAVFGLDTSLEGEEGDAHNECASGDRLKLSLPGLQNEIIKEIYESGKPCILVILSGSATDLRFADANYDAVLQGWYPGAEGGDAIAEILFGEASPEGRLPVTFYNSDEELPEFTDYSMKDRTYRYMSTKPLYPFGYGLSYTDFRIDNAKVSTDVITSAGCDVTLDVENTGRIAGATAIEIYVKAEREDAPNHSLKGLKKVFLAPGEKKSVSIHLDEKAFALWNDDGELAVEEGKYTVFAGEYQPDERSFELTGKKPAEFSMTKDSKTVLDRMA